jgi:hypothetical protein
MDFIWRLMEPGSPRPERHQSTAGPSWHPEAESAPRIKRCAASLSCMELRL